MPIQERHNNVAFLKIIKKSPLTKPRYKKIIPKKIKKYFIILTIFSNH